MKMDFLGGLEQWLKRDFLGNGYIQSTKYFKVCIGVLSFLLGGGEGVA